TLVGTLTARGAEQISVGAGWNSTGGRFNAANSTVTFTGTSTDTLTSGGVAFSNLQLNKTGQMTLNGQLNIGGNFTLTNGTLEHTTSNYGMNISSDVKLTAGTWAIQDSTVSVAGSWDTTLSIGFVTNAS